MGLTAATAPFPKEVRFPCELCTSPADVAAEIDGGAEFGGRGNTGVRASATACSKLRRISMEYPPSVCKMLAYFSSFMFITSQIMRDVVRAF